MSGGPALLTLRPLLLAASAAVLFACRSAVAPPSPLPDEAIPLPKGVIDTTPGALLRSDRPRRECPLPANLIADLEEKMVERLGKERTEFLDGFALLEAQRGVFVAELRAVVTRRTAVPPLGGEDFALEAAAAREAVAAPVSAILAETLAWLEADVLFRSAPGSDEVAPSEPSTPHGDGRPAPAGGVALAQEASPYEGQWILPLVRMMARLRGRFAGVSAAEGSTEALFRALRAAERRLHRTLETLPPPVPVPPDPTGGGISAGRRRAPQQAKAEEDRRRAAAVAEARNAARDEAEADLRRVLAALERGRPERCRPDVGSVVCRPAPVDVWTGSQFTLLRPGDPALQAEPVLELLDRFLGNLP